MSIQSKKARASLLGMVLLWSVGIASGSWLLLNHEFNTGALYRAPAALPEALQDHRSPDLPYLLALSLHPECACSRATIEQIDRLLAKNPDSIQIVAVLSEQLAQGSELASKGRSYREALAKLPHTTILSDEDGSIARHLGASLSGSIALYDADNQLRFEGGITSSRGHSGSSVGLSDLQRIARTLEPRELCQTPVFGCSLETPDP
ncbi:hypothetical protein [Pelagicoccus sp. SDUM812003]|uniref:hypothetical protein n=1 Tax=Pelagicoccus sp. SDUM812003 TaxID=3041267 RepID=UPI00280ECBB5|nr:hypothetical protein [Pelagicoccus sp. SDUM812003]MDQ8202574.1 hypothetical protein [Pelagicoccus sp. SDUM812003]